MTTAKSSFGTKLQRAGVDIAELTNIGGVELTLETEDVTNHDSVSGIDEVIGTTIKTGEIPIEGNFIPGDTNGQIALKTDLINRTLQSFAINYPTAAGFSWAFNALVTKFKVADAPVKGKLPFSASLKPSGEPVLSISASAGLTTPFMVLSGGGTLIPVAAQAITEYVYSVLTAVTTITVTPTAAAGTIKVTANGATQTVISGQASTAIALGAAGSVTTIYVDVQEIGKIAKRYTIRVARA
jgi:hypothetical protein